MWASGIRFLRPVENFFVKEVFWSDANDPLLGPKNDFYKIWTMWYGFRHVLMVQWGQASELKPHLWNDDDLWKKNGHSKNWKPPHSYQIVPILAQKSSFQYRYLEGSKWPVLQNLSLIYIIMKIHEKKFTTLNIGICCTGTLWLFLPCGCCPENSNT